MKKTWLNVFFTFLFRYIFIHSMYLLFCSSIKQLTVETGGYLGRQVKLIKHENSGLLL